VTPGLFSPPIGHSYFGFVVVVGEGALVVVALGVVVTVGGGGQKQASDRKTAKEIARTELKEFIFVLVLVTRLEGQNQVKI